MKSLQIKLPKSGVKLVKTLDGREAYVSPVWMMRAMMISHKTLPLVEEELDLERILKESYLAEKISLKAKNKKLTENNVKLNSDNIYLSDEVVKSKGNNKKIFWFGTGVGSLVTGLIVAGINSLIF